MTVDKTLRIGTRSSRLAMWQARKVQTLLHQKNIRTELIPVQSDGDIDLITPLYSMGAEGVFTKALDTYLLNNKIDIAVHSMKDVPVQPARGIVAGAILERANAQDLLVYKDETAAATLLNNDNRRHHEVTGIVATGSVRRKAQLLHRFPNLTIVNLRGNVQTRLKKLDENNWMAAIFAAAGLERINERPGKAQEINWMLPAPAQGAILVVCREEDDHLRSLLSLINNAPTALCVSQERAFLRTLMGGCATPISALANITNETLHFRGNILSPDGKEKLTIEKHIPIRAANRIGADCAQELLKKGAQKLIGGIQKS